MLKEFFCGLSEKLGCSDKYKFRINALEAHVEQLEKLKKMVDGQLKVMIEQYQCELVKNVKLNESLDLCRQAYSNPTKVPQKKISYLRNVWLGEKVGWKAQSIPVKLFITVQDEWIAQELRARKLLFEPDFSNKKKDELGKKIIDVANKGAKYTKDKVFGFSENWRFPFEYRVGLKFGVGGECDTHAINQVSHLRVAGWPADRVFVSAGVTRSGFGHATVYIKSFELDAWVHVNSTTFKSKKNSFAGFPLKDDESDSIGVDPKKFWFSFNDRIAISSFEEKEAREFFDKEKAMRKVVIE